MENNQVGKYSTLYVCKNKLKIIKNELFSPNQCISYSKNWETIEVWATKLYQSTLQIKNSSQFNQIRNNLTI